MANVFSYITVQQWEINSISLLISKIMKCRECVITELSKFFNIYNIIFYWVLLMEFWNCDSHFFSSSPSYPTYSYPGQIFKHYFTVSLSPFPQNKLWKLFSTVCYYIEWSLISLWFVPGPHPLPPSICSVIFSTFHPRKPFASVSSWLMSFW